ncbi:hypothetical protein MHU86_1531 [Fragilaria crotonensis]|nr:hypothetical protein MHU86_1531 [Fragilaria crotonensis]
MSYHRALLFATIFAAITIAAFIAREQSSPEMNGEKLMKRAEMANHSRGAKDNRSPACTFNHHRGIGLVGSKIEKIVLLHMRKAGGTSIWAYLCRVAHKYDLEFESNEARLPLLPEEADNKTLLVTHIREPTARLLSHYKYEGRWLVISSQTQPLYQL